MGMDEGLVRKLLGIPEDVRAVATIPLGYPDEAPTNPMKRYAQEFVHHDSWGNMKLENVLIKIKEDTEKAIKDFEARRLEVTGRFKDLRSKYLLRLEEKYSAWAFPNLVRRLIFASERLREPPIALINKSLEILDDYERLRSQKLRETKDIDSPEVVEHERRYTSIFITLLREWLEQPSSLPSSKI